MNQTGKEFASSLDPQVAARLDQEKQRCLEVLQARPDDAQALHRLGSLCFDTGDYVAALDHLLQVVTLDPDTAEAYKDLGRAWSALGQPEEALASFREALQRQPNSAEINFYMGCGLQALNRLDEAMPYFRRAAELQPGSAEAQNNLGAALAVSGKLAEAVVYFHKALSLNPAYPDAHKNLAAALRLMGDAVGAAASERKLAALQSSKAAGARHAPSALQAQRQPPKATLPNRRPVTLSHNSARALMMRGNTLQGAGNFQEAAECYRKALALQPDNAEVHNNLGTALKSLDRLEEAVRHFQKALALDPRYAVAYNNLGSTQHTLGRSQEAEASLRKALALLPDYPQAHNNLGNVLNATGRPAEALTHLRRALELDPRYVAAYSNQGNALQYLGLLEEAAASYQKAINLQPDFAAAYNNLGNALRLQGKYADAEPIVRKSLELQPQYPDAHSSLGLLLLLLGNFAEGWAEYEWRPTSRQPRPCPKPRWTGEPLEGRTILVSEEQGRGDTIQFVRYLPLLKARGAGKVIMECYPDLTRLLQSVEGIDSFVEWNSRQFPDPDLFDVHIPLLSLPWAFHTEEATTPAEVPYLNPDPAEAAEWARYLGGPEGWKVGLVWAGNPDFRHDVTRSVDLSAFAPLAQIPGVRLYSLQKGPAAQQAANPPEGLPIVDLAENFRDFADTAAAISSLDLVISVDTSVAHLAGALGKPVWTLLPFSPDWRWLLAREDTPWYPSMRLFRQPARGDWTTVFARLEEAMRDLTSSAAAIMPRLSEQSPSGRPISPPLAPPQASPEKSKTDYRKSTIPSLPAPQSAQAEIIRGYTLIQQNRFQEAEACFRRALGMQPQNALAHNGLGLTLVQSNRSKEALNHLKQALRLQPDSFEAQNNMGNVLNILRRPDEAIPHFQKALELNPQSPDAHHNLGNSLQLMGRLEEAEVCYHKALALEPNFPKAYTNLGYALWFQGRFAEAEALSLKAISMAPDDAEAHNSLGLLLLLLGRFEEGWVEHEWRRAIKLARPCPRPRWTGEPLEGKTILVSEEQGRGDTIQFVRYLPLLKARGAGKVIMECYPDLIRLLQGMEGIDEFVEWHPHQFPDVALFDTHIPLMSLPRLFHTDLTNIPAAPSYLRADADLCEQWRSRLAQDRNFKVGIVWAGSPNYVHDRARSCSLTQFAPLSRVAQVSLYSLQKGVAARQAVRPPKSLKLIDISADIHDYVDTAAAISSLDLVISVDTSVAHLAGALGKPVWTLLPFSPDWRWLLAREDTPWYPSMRLFRQPARGDWPAVFSHVARELQRHVPR